MGLFLKDIWLEVVLGLIAWLAIVYKLWTWNYNYWRDRNVPYVEPSFPFGNLKDFVLQRKFIGLAMSDLYFKLKGHKIGGFINMRNPGLLIRDPEIIKLIFTKDFNHFSDRGIEVPDEKTDPLSANLFSLSGNKWKILRAKLTPTFTSGKIKLMFSLINTCGQQLQKSLLEHAEKGDTIELKDYMARFGTDVIGCCAFGLNIDSINNPDIGFRRILKHMFSPRIIVVVRNAMLAIMPGLVKMLNIKTTLKERDKFFLNLVRETTQYREQNQIKRNDFLDLLIQIKNKGHIEDDSAHSNENKDHTGCHSDHEFKKHSSNEIEMTNELMAAQCFGFFFAGFETSSTTLSFCLYELALNKDIHKKMHDEVDIVLKKYNDEVTYSALKEMTYMDRVIQETLRKYSPLGVLTRECVKDYLLEESNLLIKKGMKVTIPLYGIHYDPEYYPDPERFDPDRFTEEAKKSRPHYAWLAFGEGPRGCIGIRFGLLQVKTGLAMLLSKYNFDCAPETQIPVEFDAVHFTSTPKQGIKLKITKRN